MDKITIVVMRGCPYCEMAKKAVRELGAESSIEWIDENAQPQLVSDLDYYYVPSIFAGREKLFEAHPGDKYDKIKGAVESALQKVQQ